MHPEARSVVGYSLDCLWATGSIVRQRLWAKGWSAGLVNSTVHPPALPNSSIRTSMRRRQTACRSWSVDRPAGSFAATGASHSVPAAVSQPLSSSARP
eukprot:6066671-Prymnesium_polylepis.1